MLETTNKMEHQPGYLHVDAPEQATPDKFLDDAANNPAVPTLVTTDVDEAVRWLGQEARR